MKLQKQVWKKGRLKRRAVFLDRDGTLIRHRYVVTKETHMRPLPGVVQGLRKLQELGYLMIIVSNQPGIEKNMRHFAEAPHMFVAGGFVLADVRVKTAQ